MKCWFAVLALMICLTACDETTNTSSTGSPAVRSCPLVNPHTGQLPALAVPAFNPATTTAEDGIPVPASIADPALRIIGNFESGEGTDPWINVNKTDTISFGYLQWNWTSSKVLLAFFNNLSDAHISLAPESLRGDLTLLNRARNKTEASLVIASWTTAAINDPIDGGIRSSVKAGLKSWLGTSSMRAYQRTQVDKNLRLAYSYARKWLHDSPSQKEDMVFATAYFFDLVVYNDGRAGLWRPHVEHLRAKLGNDRAVIGFIATWLRACAAYKFDGDKPDDTMYSIPDMLNNADHWEQLAMSREFSNTQIEFLLLGFLRASLSEGRNKPNGFYGIYQADVMNRRGTIALGEGYVHGPSLIKLWTD